MMHAKDERIFGDCPPGQMFYECAIGPFIGCCSTNPCGTGVCGGDGDGDDDCGSNPMAGSGGPLHISGQTLGSTAALSDFSQPPYSTSVAASISSSPNVLPPSSFALASTDSVSGTTSVSSKSQQSLASTTLQTSRHASRVSSTASATSAVTPAGTAKPTGTSHTGVVAGGVVGGLAFLGLLALLLLCCCRRGSKFSLTIKRKQVVQERVEEDVQEAEEAAASDLEQYLKASHGQRGEDPSGSSYPKNSTAIPPQKWI